MPIISENRSGRPPKIDEKLCFDTWLERTTLKKATAYLHRQGHNWSLQGIRHAAWRWVIKHPDESFAVWQEAGEFPDGRDDYWKHWIACKIRTYQIGSKVQFNRALEINGIKDWYYEQEKYQACPINMQDNTSQS